LLILVLIAKNTENKWANKRIIKKFRVWLLTHFIISVVLLFSSLFYFHDTGIGDNSIVPIGYGQTIQNEDFQTTYFFPNLTKTDPNKDAIDILDYFVTTKEICAEVSHEFSNHPKYMFLVFDLPTQTLKTFDNEKEYNNYAEKNNLPLKTKFYNFEKHYQEYLSDKPFWKTWLIP